MSAPSDMVAAFRTEATLVLLRSSLWTVPQVRAVACQLATSSPEEALAILDGVQKFEAEG